MGVSVSNLNLKSVTLGNSVAPVVNPNYLWDPAKGTSSLTPTWSEDNALYTVSEVSGGGTNFGPMSVTAISGKVYCEFELVSQNNNNNYHAFGIIKTGGSRSFYIQGYHMFSRSPNASAGCGLTVSDAIAAGSYVSIPSAGAYSFAVGDRIGIAVDMTAGKIWFRKNGTWIYGDPAAGTNPTSTFTPDTYYFSQLNYTCNVVGTLTISARIYPKVSNQLSAVPAGFTAYDPA